ncbi:MAG: hypothetical protein GY793_02270 [Proteobacteria bacterium]|nr:hypothetical protein [Pseudomonadota bacterium]
MVKSSKIDKLLAGGTFFVGMVGTAIAIPEILTVPFMLTTAFGSVATAGGVPSFVDAILDKPTVSEKKVYAVGAVESRPEPKSESKLTKGNNVVFNNTVVISSEKTVLKKQKVEEKESALKVFDQKCAV